MKLTDLQPQFLRYEKDADGKIFYPFVDSIAEAQGIEFLCPKCFVANGGSVGTHGVICWSRSRGVPNDAEPGPGRWKIEGTGYVDLTLNADPPSGARSVQLHAPCNWHGFITNGEVT
jgi:hypothetical protein